MFKGHGDFGDNTRMGFAVARAQNRIEESASSFVLSWTTTTMRRPAADTFPDSLL